MNKSVGTADRRKRAGARKQADRSKRAGGRMIGNVGILLGLVTAVLGLTVCCMWIQDPAKRTRKVQSSRAEIEPELERLSQDRDSAGYQTLLQNPGAYPSELLELAISNPETLQFVLDYPQLKDMPCGAVLTDIEMGTIPRLFQWDERWGYFVYGDHVLGISGCGPTCLSMVAAGLTGDGTVTPDKVAAYAYENGYYVSGSGTAWTLMSQGAFAFGILGEELELSEKAVFSALEAGYPVICSMRPGDFTDSGHFIVLAGVEEGKIRVHDPNSRQRSEQLWEYEVLEGQIKNLWAFSAGN